ncbi:MAG: hypothetical protein PHI63_03005 [Patescibacteria group bacterium]|nr:hypothetical protein [Patescibacteria group bacterium]
MATIVEFTDTHAIAADERGARWQVPRAELPGGVNVGDRITLCAFAGTIAQREELARTILNQLLGGT